MLSVPLALQACICVVAAVAAAAATVSRTVAGAASDIAVAAGVAVAVAGVAAAAAAADTLKGARKTIGLQTSDSSAQSHAPSTLTVSCITVAN